ncbi:MAG: GNAT family N-acetyltransferase [Myxococcales bacterium]|nr:GNAT family N-acetyltransferase [Myxococcales bacterium]MBL0195252.1 GNAT family N-acetyltransferase [Myxococcales bacterium]HQY60166.1 GNAT family N-acetyltransferase [Polyangiaceae bacterium]
MTSLVVRDAREADHEAVAALFLELETREPPPGRERYVAELLRGTQVAELDGRVAGYVYAEVLADAGYVRHVATAPWARRRGVARALFRSAKRRFREAGCASVRLNVKPDNHPAIALYRDEGLAPAYRSRVMRFSLTAIPGNPREGVVGGLLDAGRDAEAEDRFKLPRGQLTSARERGRVMVALLRPEPARATPAIVGVACFDPSFPGAFPFRVTESTLGSALLDACRMHATVDELQLVIEDDEALGDWLAAEGAETRFDLDHFVGALGPADAVER